MRVRLAAAISTSCRRLAVGIVTRVGTRPVDDVTIIFGRNRWTNSVAISTFMPFASTRTAMQRAPRDSSTPMPIGSLGDSMSTDDRLSVFDPRRSIRRLPRDSPERTTLDPSYISGRDRNAG